LGRRDGDLNIEKRSLEYAKGRNGTEIPCSKMFWHSLKGTVTLQQIKYVVSSRRKPLGVADDCPQVTQIAKKLRLSIRK